MISRTLPWINSWGLVLILYWKCGWQVEPYPVSDCANYTQSLAVYCCYRFCMLLVCLYWVQRVAQNLTLHKPASTPQAVPYKPCLAHLVSPAKAYLRCHLMLSLLNLAHASHHPYLMLWLPILPDLHRLVSSLWQRKDLSLQVLMPSPLRSSLMVDHTIVVLTPRTKCK